jgi:hypothetical protein
MAFSLETPGLEGAVRNSGHDPAIPPDRFAPIPGNNNWRSAKLASYEQLKLLRDQYGIKRVVNLAKDSMAHQRSGSGFECSYPSDVCEPKWAAALGLEYIPAYMGSSPPSGAEWSQIREAMTQGDTLIHCTHGVDRTGAVAGRWVAETTGKVGGDLLDYTYGFGGQWRNAGDPNRKLRDWMAEGRHDPALVARLNRGATWVPVALGLGAAGLLAAVIYRVRFK